MEPDQEQLEKLILQESAHLRKRYASKVDSLFKQLEPSLEHIMLNPDTARKPSELLQ